MSRSKELFKKNFIDKEERKKSTVLYGLGKQTEEVLSEFPDFPVAGILDGYCEEGEFFGRKIISLDSLIGQDIQIVILARKASEKIIYKRIKQFCSRHDIPVFNLEGVLLGQVQEREMYYAPYLQRSAEELSCRIEEYDAISFDIFDTLLVRKTGSQEMVFAMIEEKCGTSFPYAKVRMRAELELARNSVPTIYDIYEWIGRQTKASSAELSQLMQAELEMEKLVLEPRSIMVQLLKDAVSLGKQVYLVSDMYLPKEILEGILSRNEINGYDGIFVSCDYGTNKAGRLYQIYAMHSKGKRLHIGDSDELDGRCAMVQNIDTYLIKAPGDMAELTAIGNAADKVDGANGLQGMIYARLFNDPFALHRGYGKLHAAPYELGYGILGPLLTGYIHWLYGKLRKEPLDCILFISRDGYLVKKIYDLMRPLDGEDDLPEAYYVMTSRSFSVFASLETDEDISYASDLPFQGTATEMLQKRFHLENAEILPFSQDVEKLPYIMKHKNLILSKAASARSRYLKYLSPLKLNQRRAGIFDFVSTGTCQMCMEKITKTLLKGYYFERIADSYKCKVRLHIADYVHEYASGYESDNYFLLESWIKSTEPSMEDVRDDGRIVYCRQHISENQKRYIDQIQKGALEFCRDYLVLEKNGMSGEEIEEFAFHILPFINENFIDIQLEYQEHFDEFTNRKI